MTDPRAWSQENFGRNQLGTKASEQMENIKEARTREPGEGGGGGAAWGVVGRKDKSHPSTVPGDALLTDAACCEDAEGCGSWMDHGASQQVLGMGSLLCFGDGG